MVNPLTMIEEWISEHGSAAVLRDHLALLKEQMSVLQDKVSSLESENSKLKTENEHLLAELQKLSRPPAMPVAFPKRRERSLDG